jgi:hypothetical protein
MKIYLAGGAYGIFQKTKGIGGVKVFTPRTLTSFFPILEGKRGGFFMRKFIIILFALLLVAPLVAQQRTGRIIGEVVDQDGNPIPGVTVTLLATSGAPVQAISTAEGVFRFLALPPSTGYAIKCELEGFKTKTETGIIVGVGGTTELTLAMEMGALEEEVTVVAVSPVVETKKTSISTTLNYETLQSLPSARDPWVILQMTPNIQVDRENVGGNESGQQASYVAMGQGGFNQTWTMDGVNITDPAAMGATPTYWDYDVFEEVNVTLGGADMEQQTSAVALNLVSRRGENRITFGGRFYYTADDFQGTPSGADYEEILKVFPDGGYNKIRDIKDFGFNIGGPLFKDKVWWWGSYGVQEIKTTVMSGGNDDTFLNNYAAKVNIQIIPENRLELFVHAGAKEKFGRDASSTLPAGRNQKGWYKFGSPIVKVQDEHMFGDSFFVSAKYGFSDAGFGLWPADDEFLTDIRIWNVGDAYNTRYTWFMSGRPNAQWTLYGTYFNDNLLGASHEIKMGVEYADRRQKSKSGAAGNMRYNYNYNTRTVDWDGDGTQDIVLDKFGIDLRYLYFYRGNAGEGPRGVRHISGFLQDTATWGRLTLKAGIRWDRQQCGDPGGRSVETIFQQDSSETYYDNYYEIQQKYLAPGVGDAIYSIFPGVSTPPVPYSDTKAWTFLSPRIGLTYDLTGDGKTIAKLSAGIYGSRMYSGSAYLYRRGGASGNLRFWWHDASGDNVVNFNELYWMNMDDSARAAYRAFDDNNNFVGNYEREEGSSGMWWGYDWNDPGKTVAPWYNVADNWDDEKTYEAIFSLERELMSNLAVGLDATWRRYQNWWWNQNYSDFFGGTLLSRSDYVESPNAIPQTITGSDGKVYDMGEAGGRHIYVWKEGVNNVTGEYVTVTPDDYYDSHMGLSLRLTKRLSNRWMLNASFAVQQQKTHWGADYPQNPTNQWARDGQTYAYSLGAASGKIGMPVFSRWMLKAQGLYQLPYDFNVSFVFNAREGHIIEGYTGITDYAAPNSRDRSEDIDMWIYGSERMPTFWNVNLRLEKILRIGDTGRVFMMVDVFNLLNQNILNRQRDVDNGQIYLRTGQAPTISPYARSGEPNEVLNPRIFRFGLRFQF